MRRVPLPNNATAATCLIHTRRQGVAEPESRFGHRDHEVGRYGTQRISAEHLAGVRAIFAIDWTWALMSLAPFAAATSVGGIVDPVGPDGMCALPRSELTNASPTKPTPGGSSRPRAKTTSAPGHAADATGIARRKGTAAGAITNAAASNAAARDRPSVAAFDPLPTP